MNHAEGPYIQIGRCHHFTHVGQALQHFFDAVLAQGEHAGGERGVPDVRGRARWRMCWRMVSSLIISSWMPRRPW